MSCIVQLTSYTAITELGKMITEGTLQITEPRGTILDVDPSSFTWQDVATSVTTATATSK